MNWKTWTAAGVIIVVAFAIYAFAASQPTLDDREIQPVRPSGPHAAVRTPGVDPIRWEWLEPQTGNYSSSRNLFAFPAPPPPPPPPPVPAPVPPPDRDKDGVPDFQDNCPDTANSNQADIDRDGIGSACDPGEIEPPPPPPVPPPFTYKFIGTFGPAGRPIATFTRGGDIVNARVGDIIENKFILRSVGIESVEIGFVGFPRDKTQRIPLGQ